MTQYPISLWQLLEKHNIVIPIIQRDYAQGRCGEGMDVLRNRFLGNLKDALDDPEEPIKLDFIYGSVDKSDFLPLDGQQRLTTLWLLHWLIALRAGKLTDADVRERLRRFTYNTRSTAKQFCCQLVEQFSDVKANEVGDIALYIRNCKWYFRSYHYDPTIKSMLIMLSGDKKAKKYNGLEQFFPKKDTPFEVYWDTLVSENCPICFYLLDESILMSDDFYIKMNARGKPLTPFEKFKAELLDYETGQGRKYLDRNRQDDLDFISKLDNDWMQLFWRYKHSTLHRVDEIYFLFIRLYMRGYILSRPTENKQGKGKNASTGIAETFLKDSFYSIDDYAEVLTDDFKRRIFKTLNTLTKYNKRLGEGINKHIRKLASWIAPDFYFLPEYKSEKDNDLSVSVPNHRNGVIFFGLCLFFENYSLCDVDQERIDADLKDWLRFNCNISSNPFIDSIEGEAGAVRLLNELAQKGYSNRIYAHLAENEECPKLNSEAAKEQFEEEWNKARFQAVDPSLKERFEIAEHHAFFDGSIRFLLWNEEGNYHVENFECKFRNAQAFFLSEKQYTRDSIIKDSRPFQNYFNACDKLSMILSENTTADNTIRFDGHCYSWKTMLNNKNFASTTHAFLMQAPRSAEQLRESPLPRLKALTGDNQKRMDYVTNVVLEDKFIENLNEKLPKIVGGILFLRTWYEWALYPVRSRMEEKFIVLGTSRNLVLHELEKEKLVTSPYAIKESSIHYGWNVLFCYRECSFVWTFDGDIYVKERPDSKKKVEYNAEKEEVLRTLEVLYQAWKTSLGNFPEEKETTPLE